jgi:hypothetical protein
MRAINSVFWMKLNKILKIWYFIFHHSKIVGILYFVFYGELNTPSIQAGKKEAKNMRARGGWCGVVCRSRPRGEDRLLRTGTT